MSDVDLDRLSKRWSICKDMVFMKLSIQDLYRKLNTGDYDRVEITIHGTQIRLWRTRINCKRRTHLGYKSPWGKEYYPTNVNDLVEYLYKHKWS